MSRKFSIITTIDLSKIDREINEYERMGEINPYIFMSEDTANTIERQVSTNINLNKDTKYKEYGYRGCKCQYRGYKVFINNDLLFGVVEIR